MLINTVGFWLNEGWVPHTPKGWWRLRTQSTVVETRFEDGGGYSCPTGFYQEGLDGSRRSSRAQLKTLFSQTYDVWEAGAGLECILKRLIFSHVYMYVYVHACVSSNV